MKNLLNEKPKTEVHGRCLYNTKFVDDKDIKNKNILDIGCGYGWFELNILKRNCKSITGIEITEKDLKTAKENIKNKKAFFKIGSGINLPFKDNMFDTIVSWEVIEHIPRNTEDKMFREVFRVLKPNGVFYLSTPNKSFISNIFDPAWWLIGHRHYSKKDLIKFAKRNGFLAEEIIVKGGKWEIIGILDLYIAKWIFRRKPFFYNFVKKKQDREYLRKNGFVSLFMKVRKEE